MGSARSIGVWAMCVTFLAAAAMPIAARDADPSPQELAASILRDAGVRGGLIVLIGCGDGQLAMQLRAGDSYVVQALDADAGRVEQARRAIATRGLYGPVSVEECAADHLPYADNLVNLIVSLDPARLPRDEMMRVLAPGGVAYVASGGAWIKTIKPAPPKIDEWTHFLHDAGNNAVARDTVVGPPRRLQWMAPPLWLRSHETPSGFEAMVCGGGRVFYLLDEGLIGITDNRLPERWSLVCRDAFNGKLLWKRPLGDWGWPQWAPTAFAGDWTATGSGRVRLPDTNECRLVVVGDRLLATLSFRAPLSILDAATGNEIASLPQTAPVRQILAADGVAITVTDGADQAIGRGEKAKGKAGKLGGEPNQSASLTAVDIVHGSVLWQKKSPGVHGLLVGIDQGRAIYATANALWALDLRGGKNLWKVPVEGKAHQVLVASSGCALLLGPRLLETYDASNGKLLWSKSIIPGGESANAARVGLAADDLFVIDGVVWPGVFATDRQGKMKHGGDSALTIGYDLRTGREVKRVLAPDVIALEHHHRCYRNKATERYIITSAEGAEFIDLQANGHSQNNFVRGACKLGMMPCNGMLYVPPDQCFCEPGAKLLGMKALCPDEATPAPAVPDDQRLEKGPAYGAAAPDDAAANDDWPTYRHDPARHGATPADVPTTLQDGWRVKIGGNLSTVVAAGRRAYVAAIDAHTLYALDLASGKILWTFVAGGRIDSPPTLYKGLALLGSADGWIYCLRASDGALAWRFLAAPERRFVACNDQVESAWPVHGSILLHNGLAYAAAGRSSYLDGGIRLWALEPLSGKIVHQNTLSGPFPNGKDVARDVSFFARGANSDVLVSEGGWIYMRQKCLSPDLREQPKSLVSNKGESDVGEHVFSTASLLDGSWYNRTFWMYARRWPGFQLANQSPKSGQLLVADERTTYAVSVFYRRNIHSPMFFPGKEGYLLFADRNENEPQIVGDAGAKPPVAWLPQSSFGGPQNSRIALDSPALGKDKFIGYTRAAAPLWTLWLPVRVRAMVKAGDSLFAAGPPDIFDPKDPYASFEGRNGARLVTVSARDGKKVAERNLDVPPVFDGMIAVAGRVLISLEDGSLLCLNASQGR